MADCGGSNKTGFLCHKSKQNFCFINFSGNPWNFLKLKLNQFHYWRGNKKITCLNTSTSPERAGQAYLGWWNQRTKAQKQQTRKLGLTNLFQNIFKIFFSMLISISLIICHKSSCNNSYINYLEEFYCNIVSSSWLYLYL